MIKEAHGPRGRKSECEKIRRCVMKNKPKDIKAETGCYTQVRYMPEKISSSLLLNGRLTNHNRFLGKQVFQESWVITTST